MVACDVSPVAMFVLEMCFRCAEDLQHILQCNLFSAIVAVLIVAMLKYKQCLVDTRQDCKVW